MSVSFKKIETTDIDTLLRLMSDFYAIDNYPIDAEITRKNFEIFITKPDLGQCFLIEHHGKPAGYLLLAYMFMFEFGGQIAFLDELYIDPNFQRNGLGKIAVEFAQQYAKEIDLKILYLEVELHNQRAIDLYKKYNFKPHHRNLMVWKNKL